VKPFSDARTRPSRSAFATIVRDYVRPGKVRLVFSGMAFVGPDSERGLRFALAGGRQGKLWDTIHLLYASQGAENSGWVSESLLRESARRFPVSTPTH
jgi:protein-disulfide isomerase